MEESKPVTPHNSNASDESVNMLTSQPVLFGDGCPLSATLQWYPRPARPYSRRELLAGRVVDFGGVFLGVVGGIALIVRSVVAGDALWKVLGLLVYSLGIVTMLGCSAACHHYAWNWNQTRRLSSLDYMGISAMIAGSYTPPMLEGRCYSILAFVWALGVAGTLLDVWKVRRGDYEVTGAYRCVLVGRFLIMGWSVLLVIDRLRLVLPTGYIILIAIGGVLYTAGVPVFLSPKEFHMPAWHIFVITAAIIMYLANYIFIAGS